MNDTMLKFGLNINNREPLITDEYSVDDMFEMAVDAERLGFDSVWVGDSLLEKPRLEAVACLTKAATVTESVDLGTSCMVTPLRNPIQLAQSWATLDILSGGRTILGACMAATSDELGRKQYEVVGVDPRKRATALREGIEIMKGLWEDGSVSYDGDYFEFDDVSFDTGNERNPFRPVQRSPPVWVVSNPSSRGQDAVHGPAVRRIVDVGDGWMTCCRAQHPEEYEAQIAAIGNYADKVGRGLDDISKAYQVTLHIGDSREEAKVNMTEYVDRYYPHQYYNLDDWGPIGTPEDVIEWLETFADIGCDTFIIRFGAFDQREQLRRFADDVLPAFE